MIRAYTYHLVCCCRQVFQRRLWRNLEINGWPPDHLFVSLETSLWVVLSFLESSYEWSNWILKYTAASLLVVYLYIYLYIYYWETYILSVTQAITFASGRKDKSWSLSCAMAVLCVRAEVAKRASNDEQYQDDRNDNGFVIVVASSFVSVLEGSTDTDVPMPRKKAILSAIAKIVCRIDGLAIKLTLLSWITIN